MGREYLLHLEIDKDPAVVTMYDRNGKKVLEARMEPPDAVKVSIGAISNRTPNLLDPFTLAASRLTGHENATALPACGRDRRLSGASGKSRFS